MTIKAYRLWNLSRRVKRAFPDRIAIIFSPIGDVVADCNAEAYAVRFWEKKKNCIVATESIITAIRVLVCEGKIDHEKIIFYDEKSDSCMEVNTYGVLPHWVRGFCETDLNLVERILLGGIEKRKKLEVKKKLNV